MSTKYRHVLFESESSSTDVIGDIVSGMQAVFDPVYDSVEATAYQIVNSVITDDDVKNNQVKLVNKGDNATLLIEDNLFQILSLTFQIRIEQIDKDLATEEVFNRGNILMWQAAAKRCMIFNSAQNIAKAMARRAVNKGGSIISIFRGNEDE